MEAKRLWRGAEIMKKYMLILFSYAGLNELEEELFRKIDKGDKLLVRCLLLEGVPKLFNHLISDVGFLGEKVVCDVEDSVVEIYRDNAEMFIKEINSRSAEQDIDVETELLNSTELENLKMDINLKKPAVIWLNLSRNDFVADAETEAEMETWLENKQSGIKVFVDGKVK